MLDRTTNSLEQQPKETCLSHDSLSPRLTRTSANTCSASDKEEMRKEDTIVTDNGKSEEEESEFGDNDVDEEDEYPYTVYPRKIIWMIIIVCASEGLLSTISGPSFFGCLNQVKDHFHVTDETVNLAIVVYFICQGIAPTCFTFLVDSGYIGKRNLVLTGCIIYGTTNIGIANAKTFGTILGLRCIQSFSISPVIAVNSSIAADITKRENRGNIVGLVSGFQMCAGSAFGSVISAGLTNQFGWKGIFYYLSIMAYSAAIIVFLFLPETRRSDCGNGSLRPSKFVNRAPITYTKYWRTKFYAKPYEKSVQPLKKTNILGFVQIIKKKEIICLLIGSGMQFCLWTCHMTSIATILSNSHYNLDTLTIGKCYLPSGICTLISVVAAGRALNWNYKRKHREYTEWVKTQEQNEDFDINLPKYKFNLYKTRLEFANIPMVISGVSFIVCAWMMETKQKLAPILVFSGLGCLFSNCILPFSTTLIIDLHPYAGSTAAGLINLSRCLLSALFVAVLDYMFVSMGVGGTFILISGITTICSLSLIYAKRNALEWEYEREHGKSSA